MIQAEPRIDPGPRVQAGGLILCTDRSRGLLSEVSRYLKS